MKIKKFLNFKDSYKYIITFLFVLIFCSNSFGQTTDSLAHYLKIAEENNPELRAAFYVYEAALEKIPQAAAFQDPQLDMGFFLEPMELIDGRQAAQFQIMQMFPWFGTRKAARTETEHMAKMAFEQFRETRDQLFFDVYTQWFTLCRLRQQLNNSHESKELLLQLEELALKRFSSPTSSSTSMSTVKPDVSSATGNMQGMTSGSSMKGMTMGNTTTMQSGQNAMSMPLQENMSQMGEASSSMVDLLSIRLEIAELDNNIESILSQTDAEKVRFNALLNRPLNTEISIPDSLEQIYFLFDLEKSMQTIRAQNPMLGMIIEEEASFKAKAEMDKKMSYPMFGIGLQYMLINKKPVSETDHGMSSMNGKDMFMPMLSMSIPLFRNKYDAQQRENELLQKASREKYINTLNMFEVELHSTKNQLDNAERKIRLYQTQSELVRTTLNLQLQEFASGKGNLSNVIQVQRQLLDYLLKEVEAIIDYNMMVANVQKLLSTNDK